MADKPKKPKWYEVKKKAQLAGGFTGAKACQMPYVKNGKRGKCSKKPGHRGDHG